MMNLRLVAGVVSLSLALALVGCGQADQNAALTVASVPAAEVFVDGVSQGTSTKTLSLPPGEHKVEFRAEGFKAFETAVVLTGGETLPIEAVLEPLDPSSPTVVASLMESEGLELAPWVAPETTRGRRGKQAAAVLLWPSKDVREEGLINFAIEADETYAGDASLEFRSGRDVLYREKFNPATITSIRPIPAEVLEHVKVNSRITWGLYFEDRRRPIKATFKIVRRPNAERQLERVRTSRHMLRQPEITRKIAEAVVLENNRLYSEALAANLTIAIEHPSSTQPLRGIITTLRRLDAEGSELFATISPHVGGRGGRAAASRDVGLGISAWSPAQSGGIVPSALADAGGAAKPMGPGGAGLTPTGGRTAPGGATDPATAPDAPAQGTPEDLARREAEAMRTRVELEGLSAEAARVAERLLVAQRDAEHAQGEANAASEAAEQAEAEAMAAREAVENAKEPTPEQVQRMAEAGRQAEAAREAATAAADAAARAGAAVSELERAAEQAQSRVADLQRALADSQARPTDKPEVQPAPTLAPSPEMQKWLESAQTDQAEAARAEASAATAFAAAQAAERDEPTEANRAAVEAAAQALELARAAAVAANAEVQKIRDAMNAAGAKPVGK